MGMVLPFATGFVLGSLTPDSYLADPAPRLFSFFLATAMSISAMPVIAKILLDLDLTRRNIGLVILSAGVVDDTAGG
jgi:Kef-type K+ transport system membrane component KefB